MIKRIRILLDEPLFVNRHKKRKEDFTRKRKLIFADIVILLLQKGMMSLQLRLNEYLEKMRDKGINSVSGSAFSQARNKLCHGVFKELNTRCVVPLFYTGTYNVWEGRRILAVDGSKIRLPFEENIKEEYGVRKNSNSTRKPECCMALASVLYDVGNRIVLDADIEPITVSERELAYRHLSVLGEGRDLIIYDRGYMGYSIFAIHKEKKKDFLCRCQQSCFKGVDELFQKDCPIKTKTIQLIPNRSAKRQMQAWGIDNTESFQKITVRFVRVVLKTGEIEVLATSLLDENQFPNEIFSDLYFERWGAETYYDLIKNRLELENFSGKTAESVKQDFFSTIFLTNFESVLTKSADSILKRKKGNQYPQKVNKAVSFNALKNNVYELLLSENNPEKILPKLESLFLSNPTIIRKDRDPPRKKIRDDDRVHFLKRLRKHCF